jgi:hypothetical protein
LFGRSFSPAHYLLNGSDKSKIRLFNIASEKKQSFFAHVFGFTPFYFYIFIRKNRLGRKAAYKTNRSGCWCFPQGEKLSAPGNSTRQDDIGRPFFISCRRRFLLLEWASLSLLLEPVVVKL